MSTTTTTRRPVVQHAQRLSRLAAWAIVGQVILAVSAWLLPLWSEFSLIGDTISELALGRYGFAQTAAFLIAGLTTLGLAFAIRRLTQGWWGSLAGSLLIAVYGAGAVGSAVLPTDRIDSPADLASLSVAGMIHIAVALVSFVCAIVGMFILTRTFSRANGWQAFSRLSVYFPAGALALLIVQSEGPLVGLLQRLLVAVVSAWLILVARKIRMIVTPATQGAACQAR
jgi:magnesium-transporting ATPase (P-type)